MPNPAAGMTRRGVALGLAAAGTGVVAAAAGSRGTRGNEEGADGAAATVSRSRSAAEAARLTGYFPNVTLTSHHGSKVRFYDDLVRGKALVATVMYTTCAGVCPKTIANLIQVKEALGARAGRDVFFYALTLLPVTDSPAVLAAYAERVGAGPGFTFLTGAREDITLVRRRLGLFDRDPVADADRASHGAVAVCGNEPLGRWCHVLALGRPERILRTLSWVAPTRHDAPRPRVGHTGSASSPS